jgi:hypothetical protein
MINEQVMRNNHCEITFSLFLMYNSDGSPLWASWTQYGSSGIPYCLNLLDSGQVVWLNGAKTQIYTF